MPKIKINKQLNRPDGGTVSSGSIASSNPRMIEQEAGGVVKFITTLHFSESAMNDDKPGVPAVTQFSYKGLQKTCTQAEWDAMNDEADAGALVTATISPSSKVSG